MAVTLCCLLWARPGQEAALAAYEDTVLALMPGHGASVLQRLHGGHEPGDPTEIHVLRFPTEESFDSYMADPKRTSLAAERDAAIERTQLMVVDPID